MPGYPTPRSSSFPTDRMHSPYVITHGVPPTTRATRSHGVENERILITTSGAIDCLSVIFFPSTGKTSAGPKGDRWSKANEVIIPRLGRNGPSKPSRLASLLGCGVPARHEADPGFLTLIQPGIAGLRILHSSKTRECTATSQGVYVSRYIRVQLSAVEDEG
ncbi:uncharacterized protein AKAW2_60266A [Aspergillus luchuensis]|uniref:Uncharacterized protein n=1 Tax=Aspergillus kawachii TaxID=1069201 RepID=A0A7R7WFE0_ASPKA|nr:uncharacterized protein AKAW2_60266A [Aspergillus luchuensis]BCS02002.1 hypothetical protein AKAW2_60266A [Aspergillus luchuensis]